MRPSHSNQWRGYYPEEYPSIRIQYKSLSVYCNAYDIKEHSRITVSDKEVAVNAHGNSVITDRCADDKHQWDLTLSLGVNSSRILDAIIALSEYDRKHDNFQPIVLSDIVKPIINIGNKYNKAVIWEVPIDTDMSQCFAIFDTILMSSESKPVGLGDEFNLTLKEL